MRPGAEAAAGYPAWVVSFLVPLMAVTSVVLLVACLVLGIAAVAGIVAFVRRTPEE